MKNSRFSRINEVLTVIIDLIYIGVLWLLCSVPLVTLGVSSTALYYAVVKCIRHDRGGLTSTFFQGFRRNFRQATLVWLLLAAYTLVMAADAYALGKMGLGSGGILYALSRLLFLPPLFLFPWVFPYLSRFENTLGGSLKFGLLLLLRYPLRSLLLAAELLGFLLVSWLQPMLLPLLPGPVCLLMSLTIEPVFRLFQPDAPEGSDIDTWYNE